MQFSTLIHTFADLRVFGFWILVHFAAFFLYSTTDVSLFYIPKFQNQHH
jgi:maltodextrin utilization protein YvdJ